MRNTSSLNGTHARLFGSVIAGLTVALMLTF
jgi:hypothetical protein